LFNIATDAFMSELREIEVTLERLKIGLPCELTAEPIHAPRDEEQENASGELVTYRYVSVLAYERLPGGWGFTVRDYRGQRDLGGECSEWTLVLTTPLLNSARKTCIAAAPLIPRLLDVLVQMVTESLHTLTAVVDTSAQEKPLSTMTPEKLEEIMLQVVTWRQ
jgi:hypothetical protein